MGSGFFYREVTKDVISPWTTPITLFPGGGHLDTFFNLYNSLGDKTLTGSNQITTKQDGPEQVVRYGNLVVGDGTTATTLTASNRCKGLTLLCDSLIVKANATIGMTARGARIFVNDDPFFPFVDFVIPKQITLASSVIAYRDALDVIRKNGFAPWDQGTWQDFVQPLYGFTLTVTQAGTVVLLSAAGCGDGANGAANSHGTSNGSAGGAGSSGGMGGGGSGAVYQGGSYNACSAKAGKGSPYSGGSGSGGVNSTSWLNNYPLNPRLMTRYSGPGGSGGEAYGDNTHYCDEGMPGQGGGSGGTGNPGGPAAPGGGAAGNTGTGGKLVIICRGALSVQSGGRIEANGVAGGGTSGTSGSGGGGSGGGHITIITPTSENYSNAGTVQAAGGPGGTSASYGSGGPGGAGSVVTKVYADMGW